MIIVDAILKGPLIDLLGKSSDEALRGQLVPVEYLEGPDAERLVWVARAADDEVGCRFHVGYTARLYQGKVWAVGIHADQELFLLARNEQGNASFVVYPKEGRYRPEETNWVSRKNEVSINIGVGK